MGRGAGADRRALVEEARRRQTKREALRGAERAKRPALAEAEAIHDGFIERLREFRVLDPACGSGNFLYRGAAGAQGHRAPRQPRRRGARPASAASRASGRNACSGSRSTPMPPSWRGCRCGSAKSSGCAATASTQRATRSCGRWTTIECRDAVARRGRRGGEMAAQRDVIVGNPPFLGGKKLIERMLGRSADDTQQALAALMLASCPGSRTSFAIGSRRPTTVDLRAGTARAGLVATNSIRGGATTARS